MIEHERSYVMSHAAGEYLLEKFGQSKVYALEDYYQNKDLRIRNKKCDEESTWILTLKRGNKSDGYRFEQEESISPEVADILKLQASLVVKKDRFVLNGFDQSYQVTIDFISTPMRLAILEIEALNEVLYPVPSDICKKLTGFDLKECPLSTWNLFNRKIGICGAPSSGKSETAKWLSHVMNTRFNANSFHVVEFATSFIQKYKRNPKFYDQFFIWYGQKSRELDARSSNIIVSDCPTFLSYIYMQLLNKTKLTEDTAMYLSKIYKRVLFDINSYTDIVFMQLQNYSENNVRYQSADEAMEIQERITRFLDDHNVSHIKTDYKNNDQLLLDLFYINQLGGV